MSEVAPGCSSVRATMTMPSRILCITPDLGINEDHSYRPGGLAQFSRCVSYALASAGLSEVTVWSLLDSTRALRAGLGEFIETLRTQDTRVTLEGFDESRTRMAAKFIAQARAYDFVLFLHIGVGRLAALLPERSYGLWLVGTEVRRRLSFIEQYAVKRANPLLTISKFSSDEMVRLNPTLSPAEVVHLCLEPDAQWLATPVDERVSYEARTRKPVVLIVARMAASERYKGHDQLIDAWPTVVASCPEAELKIVGTGDDVERLRARAQALPENARHRVVFAGRLDHDELLRAYAESRVFAMPSTGEGFGLVFVEAMRFGLPCICSTDAAREVVVHEETGLCVEQTPSAIADACVRLLTDDALADRFSRAGFARYQAHFKFEHFRSRLYQSLSIDDVTAVQALESK